MADAPGVETPVTWRSQAFVTRGAPEHVLTSIDPRHPLIPAPPREGPIRAELFGIERLEQHAESLAAAQPVTHAVEPGPAPAGARRGQRARPPRVVPRHRHRHPRGARDHAGGGVAGRQLPRRRRAAARDPRRPPARVLPRAAQARRGAARRLPARLRHRLGVRGPHRQPVRPRDAPALRARLPARAAADHRRAVGGGDHAARRARREPPAPGREHRARAGGPPGGRRAGRRAAGRRRRRDRVAGPRGASRGSRAPRW